MQLIQTFFDRVATALLSGSGNELAGTIGTLSGIRKMTGQRDFDVISQILLMQVTTWRKLNWAL